MEKFFVGKEKSFIGLATGFVKEPLLLHNPYSIN